MGQKRKNNVTIKKWRRNSGFLCRDRIFRNVSPAGEISEGAVIPFTATIRVNRALTTAATKPSLYTKGSNETLGITAPTIK
ncbi:MAG: hypothetical protein LBD17_01935 [Endomicrobium sp.]|nr:hypothetical protein [Endomicrobium sp.]